MATTKVKRHDMDVHIHDFDGLTADEIQNIVQRPLPYGVITLWYGSLNDIPSGWVLCDGSVRQGAEGSYRTPPLTDRLVMGAGKTYVPDSTGGTPVFTTTIKGTTAGHALTVDEMPSHDHPYTDEFDDGRERGGGIGHHVRDDNRQQASKRTGRVGGNKPHVHGFDVAATVNVLPPFYALAYIMFIGVPTGGGN